MLPMESLAQFTASRQTNVIDGVVSNWVGKYYVGDNAAFDQLQILNSGVLSDSQGFVGHGGSASNNSALVSGTGSTWSNQAELYVGFLGKGNSLTIIDGGGVVNSYGIIGLGSNADNNSALVSGTGSEWNNQAIYVGDGGKGNLLSIGNGGVVISRDPVFVNYIGLASDNNNMLVSGTGSVWSNQGSLIVGSQGTSNSLVINHGGVAINEWYCWIGSVSSNNSVVVSDGGLLQIGPNELVVGYNGVSNTLVITNNGTVVDSYGYIGWAGTNNSVLVKDSGSLWTNRASLLVGYNGGTGNSLVIRNGGTVVSSNMVVAPDNFVTLDGGNLIVTSGLVVSNNAVLKGTGTIRGNLTLAGTLAPGNSPGALTNFGNVTLQSSAVLDFELGGRIQGTEYDFILVTNGVATLNGLLRVSIISGFETNALNSDIFTLLTADTLTGSFTNVLSGERLITASGEGSFLVNYNGNDLVLSDYQAIPEAMTLTLCAFGLAVAFILRRERFRRRLSSRG
jgi:T5SS/PEP-CTERM-associated repeat protein